MEVVVPECLFKALEDAQSKEGWAIVKFFKNTKGETEMYFHNAKDFTPANQEDKKSNFCTRDYVLRTKKSETQKN